MPSAEPQLAIPGVFDAPRTLPIRAFIDPGHLARRWGRSANTFPRDELEFDVRTGGFRRWTEALDKLDATLRQIRAAATEGAV